MSLLIVRFVNATEGLDTSVVTELGFDVEPSPNLPGAHVVVNDLPPTLSQWVAVTFMAFAMLTVLLVAVHHAKYNPATRHLIATCSIGIFASCLHNIDNILRPGTYFTPSWIVAPKLGLFPMDQGFMLWLIVLITGASSIQFCSCWRGRGQDSTGTDASFMPYSLCTVMAVRLAYSTIWRSLQPGFLPLRTARFYLRSSWESS